MTDFYSSSDTLDLWKATQRVYPWQGQPTVLLGRHGYPFVSQVLRKDKYETKDGTEIMDQMVLTESGNAGYAEADEDWKYNVKNVLGELHVPWRLARAYYVTTHDAIEANKEPNKLVDLLKLRRADGFASLAEAIEHRAPMSPDSATDKKNPHGLRAWITPITGAQVTAKSFGRIGANPFYSDGTTTMGGCGGNDTSTDKFSRYRNYVDGWTNGDSDGIKITQDDIDKIRMMLMETHWEGPMTADQFNTGIFEDQRYYTGREVVIAMERALRGQNENLGADLGMYRGSAVIKGNPIIRVDDLDYANDPTYPLFQVDHAVWKLVVPPTGGIFETPPDHTDGNPLVYVTNIFLKHNYICRDRGRCACISKVAAA